ncbi:MAG: hypothetical protein R3D83_04785 [Caenibius sp.]
MVFSARKAMDFPFERGHLRCEFGGEAGKLFAIDPNAVALPSRRPPIGAGPPVRKSACRPPAPDAALSWRCNRQVTSASSPAYSVARSSGTSPKGICFFAGPANILEFQRSMAEMALRQFIPCRDRRRSRPRLPASWAKLITIVSSTGPERDAMARQHVDVIFDVLSTFSTASLSSSGLSRVSASAGI